MPADPAEGARENGANESTTQNHAAQEREEQQPLREPIGARLGAILADMGELPEGVEVEGQGQEAEQESEQEERSAPPQRQAKPPGPHARSGRAGKGSPDASEQHDAEELTPEQRRNTDPKLLARIDKVTAQRTAERERRETVERENAELRAKLVAPATAAQPATAPATRATPQDPLADVQTPDQLREYADHTEELHAWAMANLDGATDVNIGKDAQGNDIIRDISAAEARKIWSDTDKLLRKTIPQKAASFQQEARVATERQQYDEQAKEDYPEVFTPGTEANKIAIQVVQRLPQLQDMPDGALHLGAYVEGVLARQAREAAKKGNGNGAGKGAGKDAIAAFTRARPVRAPQLPRVERPSTTGSRAEATDNTIREAAEHAADDDRNTEDLVGAILDRGRQQRSGHVAATT